MTVAIYQTTGAGVSGGQYVGHLGGWRDDLEDRKFLRGLPTLSFAAGPEPTEDVDLSEGLPILNQMQQGACAAFARMKLGMILNQMETGYHETLCPQFAYITAQMCEVSYDQYGREVPRSTVGIDCGSTISGNMRAWKKYGHCRDGLWLYTGQYRTQIPEACYQEGKLHHLLQQLDCRAYEKTRDFVSRRLGGVQIGIDWGACRWKDNWIIVDYVPNPDPRQRSGHSVAITGAMWKTLRDQQGNPALKGDNSWTENFGNRGRFAVMANAFRKMMADQYNEAIGASSAEIFRRAGVAVSSLT